MITLRSFPQLNRLHYNPRHQSGKFCREAVAAGKAISWSHLSLSATLHTNSMLKVLHRCLLSSIECSTPVLCKQGLTNWQTCTKVHSKEM